MYKSINFSKVSISSMLLLIQLSQGWSKGVGRIIDGEDANIESVPSLVQLYQNGENFCSATLVSKQHVVTAAHCVENFEATELFVKAGASQLLESGIISKVIKKFVPEDWDQTTYNMDIAVLRLETPLEGPLIQVADMCEKSGKHGQVVRTYGWGRTSFRDSLLPNQLQSVDLFFMDRNKCDLLYRGIRKFSDTILCTAAPGKGPCKGDSGGPMFINGKFCAVISAGVGCAKASFPDLNTDLMNPNVQQFIKKSMKM